MQTTTAKRYAVDMDMYIYASNDKEAMAFLKTIIKDLNNRFDNGARAKKMVEIPFGSFNTRQIDLDV